MRLHFHYSFPHFDSFFSRLRRKLVMRPSPQSHLSVLEKSASVYASAPAFKVPAMSQHGQVKDWIPISYSQFREDVNLFARYWIDMLHSARVPQKSVVALWLQGMSYIDVLQVLGLSKAGYVPLLLWCSADAVVIVDLIRRGNAQALIYDNKFIPQLPPLPIPTLVALDIRCLQIPNIKLPDSHRDGEETAFLFHTAGITLGTPKLVPCSYTHLDVLLRKAETMCIPKDNTRQDVYSWRCSISNISALFSLFGRIAHGSCLVQPTRGNFSSIELVDMISRGGVNRLHRSTSLLASDIREFRKDRNLAQLLSGLDEILQGGKMLEREDEEWLVQNGLPLTTIFGTTEVPMILSSSEDTGIPSLLRPLDGVGAAFVPFTAGSPNPLTYQNVNTRVLELVIPSASPYCPDPSLRNADGMFHTGDLFLEVSPGTYTFRGRVHDWLHSQNGQSFDAKVIEDNLRLTCREFIAECVVVGNGRPSPVVLVELAGIWDPEWIKKEIIRRTRHFHSRRLPHERMTSSLSVVIVTANSWPRTPIGKIRRQDVEQLFKTELDQLYATLPRT